MEEIAIDVLNIGWKNDKTKTADMLTRVAPNWGNITVISVAYNAGLENFMAQTACYHKLCQIWRGDISLSTPYPKVTRYSDSHGLYTSISFYTYCIIFLLPFIVQTRLYLG